MIPSFNDHPSRENIDRKVFQKSKKKKKKTRMESCRWIDGKLDIDSRGIFKRQLQPSSDFSRHEFWTWAIFGRQGPKPHRDGGCNPMGGTLGSIFLVGSLSMAGPPPPFAIPFIFLRRPTNSRPNCDFSFSSTADVFQCEPRS